MTFMYYEGTMDFIAATPAMIVTFEASGSIVAGHGVVFDAGTEGSVYHPSANTISGSLVPAGVALQTVSDGGEVAVLVWGYAKNLPVLSETAIKAGWTLVITGSGHWCTSGSLVAGASVVRASAGRVVTGSTTGTCVAFIDCMK